MLPTTTRLTRDPFASTVHLPPGAWATVLDALCARFITIDRAQWVSRIKRGRVLDEHGKAVALDTPHRSGLCIHYYREVAEEMPIPAAESILHVDEHILLADKPHFLPVQPAGDFVEQTLLRRLIRRTGNPNLVPLHRIDRLTAGLVLFSTNPASRAAYHGLFRAGQVTKRYLARAPALPALGFPLLHSSRVAASKPFFRMGEVVGPPNSATRIEVVERGAGTWCYALYPATGRKHQLRVHMAALGAPITNDPWYPQLRPQAPDDHDHPLQLLAERLSLQDPLTHQLREFESRLTL
ncbi:MAG: pseudouridine synthase [Rhodanobacter sp.]